jgi:hypothetical protein
VVSAVSRRSPATRAWGSLLDHSGLMVPIRSSGRSGWVSHPAALLTHPLAAPCC